MTIHANIEAKEAAWEELASHPMAGQITVEGDTVLIIYPAGDFPTDGLRTNNTAAGMRSALRRMETDWQESYP